MSLDTWKAEFYPVDAGEVLAAEAAAHSLRKWEGLRAEALARHGLEPVPGSSSAIGTDREVFPNFALTCALCQCFYDHDASDEPEDDEAGHCDTCPLSIARGNVRCDAERDDEGRSPYDRWTREKNPEPMIHWLKATVEGSAK